MDDHYATKDELIALNVRPQAMETRESATYDPRPAQGLIVATNHITTPPAIVWSTNTNQIRYYQNGVLIDGTDYNFTITNGL